jgi:hypothetical protein
MGFTPARYHVQPRLIFGVSHAAFRSALAAQYVLLNLSTILLSFHLGDS